eukprot:TRINITY_DN27539_c0_g1_i2.p2 TRINITY_DN27539_c0_g1~~TRINITY_DN27539_c0_g1_i2.p2  ORF type:complete len:184 (-),score=45.24 TRINITY_DN27539_c0_g1_i2:101-652(-)
MAEGPQLGMSLASPQVLLHAFQMLDPNNEKKLPFEEACSWLRCAGWIVPQPVLKHTLENTLSRHGGGVQGNLRRAKWTYNQLLDVHEKGPPPSEHGGGPDDLAQALLQVNNGRQTISLARLRAVCVAGGIPADDIEKTLRCMGLDEADTIPTKTLADDLLSVVSKPPMPSELHDVYRKSRVPS